MHRRTARGNRVGLAVTGLLLLLAGAALIAANRGYYGSAGKRQPLYPPAARRFVHDQGSWLWPVIAAAAIIVGLVFLRWLLVQPRTDRLRRLVLDTDNTDRPGGDLADTGAGRTGMPASAVTDIVEDDIAALQGVRRVAVTLSGHVDAPQLWVRLTAAADADLARIKTAITGQILADACTCLQLPELPTYLRLTVSPHAGGRAVR